MKLYYYLNQYVMCAVCLFVCNYEYDNDMLRIDTNLKGPIKLLAYCNNVKCSQFNKRMEIKPVEVEGMEA